MVEGRRRLHVKVLYTIRAMSYARRVAREPILQSSLHNMRRGARLDHVFYLPVRVQSACCCHGGFYHLGQDVVPELRGRRGLADVAPMSRHWGGHLMLVLRLVFPFLGRGGLASYMASWVASDWAQGH